MKFCTISGQYLKGSLYTDALLKWNFHWKKTWPRIVCITFLTVEIRNKYETSYPKKYQKAVIYEKSLKLGMANYD